MVDWTQGGWTGSVRRLVRNEVRTHLRTNRAYRRVRYNLSHRLFRSFFLIEKFSRYIVLYLIIDILFVAVEAFIAKCLAKEFLDFSSSPSAPLVLDKMLLSSVSGYFIATQVGILGIVALALALVSLIAQRENSATDILVYYHESLAFQIVASSLALLAILVIQLIWPLQMVIHRIDLGMKTLVFEFGLLALHLVWLIVNLGAIAYFIATTFRFVQQSTRELLRERYTANVVFPRDLTSRLHESIYMNAAYDLSNIGNESAADHPTVTFGFDYGEPFLVELTLRNRASIVLWDVRMNWIRWVARRWSERCRKSPPNETAPTTLFANQEPLLWFTPNFAFPVRGRIDLCKRRGGVRFTAVEKLVLRHAFRFRRASNGS